MSHKCYISFKAEDLSYKNHIQTKLSLSLIDRSLNVPIESDDVDYIMRRIREDYLSDSTVTIHLIGIHGAENRGWLEQRFIKRELQASLFDGVNNTRNGILGVVLPEAISRIFYGASQCATCGQLHQIVALDDSTTISEFSYNYYIPNGKCAHTEDDRYCVITTWDEFVGTPAAWIESAFAKRSAPISAKVRVRP